MIMSKYDLLKSQVLSCWRKVDSPTPSTSTRTMLFIHLLYIFSCCYILYSALFIYSAVRAASMINWLLKFVLHFTHS